MHGGVHEIEQESCFTASVGSSGSRKARGAVGSRGSQAGERLQSGRNKRCERSRQWNRAFDSLLESVNRYFAAAVLFATADLK